MPELEGCVRADEQAYEEVRSAARLAPAGGKHEIEGSVAHAAHAISSDAGGVRANAGRNDEQLFLGLPGNVCYGAGVQKDEEQPFAAPRWNVELSVAPHGAYDERLAKRPHKGARLAF